MGAMDFKNQSLMDTLVSEEFSGWSDPITVTQDMINDFANLSGETLWIHTDPDRCAEQSPFKSTIAQGFLILSLLSRMPCGEDVTKKISGYRHIMNYGSDKLRFLQPVLVNSDIHACSRVINVEVSERKTVVTLETQVQIVGADKPSLLYQLSLVLI